jgi:hypothetical protein
MDLVTGVGLAASIVSLGECAVRIVTFIAKKRTLGSKAA